MRKDYNKGKKQARKPEKERDAQRVAVEIPLPMIEVIATAREAFETLCGDVGKLLIMTMLEYEGKEKAGDKHSRNPQREANWWGKQKGSVYFAGQRMEIMKPRLRTRDGREVTLETYEALQNPDRMEQRVLGKMICGVSTRNYEEVVESFVEGTGKNKSSVSRHFVRATAKQLEAFMNRSLADLSLCAIYIDGIEFKGTLLVAALGVARDGTKHVLGFRQGATENHVVCDGLLEDLVSRGLDAGGNYLFVLDGSRALVKSVKKMFGDDVAVQRCQQHKRRNVLGHLPDELHEEIDGRLKAAYNMESFEDAKKSLELTVRYLANINPDAAASLREGLEETLTVHKLDVSQTLRKTLSSTNPIESAFSHVRHLTARVKRWRNADMVRRWTAASFLRAEGKFRRVKGYRDLSKLVMALSDKSLVFEGVAA